MAAEPEKPPTTLPSKTYGFPAEAFDHTRLPDVDTNFLPAEDLEAFIQALGAPDAAMTAAQSPAATAFNASRIGSPPSLWSTGSLNFNRRHSIGGADGKDALNTSNTKTPDRNNINNNNRSGTSLLFAAQNDWAPVNERVASSSDHKHPSRWHQPNTKANKAALAAARKQQRRAWRKQQKRCKAGSRSRDETREGYLYGLLKWPFLVVVGGWIVGLAAAYLATRAYISAYEQLVTWRGRRERLRRAMRASSTYGEWVAAARAMDEFLGNARWREENEFAYYDSRTVSRVGDQIGTCRAKAEAVERQLAMKGEGGGLTDRKAVEDLKALMDGCVKNNFAGVENPRLYSQTYYGTKNLVQNFVDEVEKSIKFLMETKQLGAEEKRVLFKGIHANYGRTALCLSGGATFAYYHFGVVRALLEEDCVPDIITGTSGGALVAALVATRTNDELRQLLVPALAYNITACSEPFAVWFRRWWTTGARFDSVAWAKQCAWWTRGSLTFREAYKRTGRILNVSCVPADPHSPTILCNYLTSPDCVIWSAVLASAAVPGIMNPVVLMMKTRPAGRLCPYSFGHKWKDGSLRTDIPVRALNLHFNVNFTIVSQVNPHVNLFFFSSRGNVGQPVTHRRGRGWRGGYLGSATEQYLKLDLTKWLKVLRHLELLPRPLGQDWSQLWLQQFGGTVTIWPRSTAADFWRILSDPDEARMARIIHEGRQSAFPKICFVGNRLRVERLVERGRRAAPKTRSASGGGESTAGPTLLSDEETRTSMIEDHTTARKRLQGLGLDCLVGSDGAGGDRAGC